VWPPSCRSGGLAEDFADQGAADSVEPCDLAQALSGPAVTDDSTAIDVQWPSPDMLALDLGAQHAGAHPLDDQVTFQFGR
jgi:hypothetical protein